MATPHPDNARGRAWPAWLALLPSYDIPRILLGHLRVPVSMSLLLGRSLRSIALDLLRSLSQAGAMLKRLSFGGSLVYRGLEFKRWHGLAAAYVTYKAVQALHRAVKYLAQTGQRRVLRRRMRGAASHE